MMQDNLHCDEYGDPARPALLCIHGLGGGGYFFAGLAQSLQERYHVLCPDMPGSGLSPRPPEPISLDYLADVVVDLMQRKTSGPFTLLGHSMGTIITLKAYAKLRQAIESLIFVGGLPTPLLEAQSRLRDRAAMARKSGMAAVAPTITPIVFSQRSHREIPDKIAMFERLLAASDAEGYAQTACALAEASGADAMPQVAVPSLCMTGSEDRYAPPAAAQDFAKSLRASYEQLPDCAHMPFFENPQRFNQFVRDWLDKRD